jgi:hypothetical protein
MAEATVINLPGATIYCTAEQLPAVLGQLATVSVVNMPGLKIVVLKEVRTPEPPQEPQQA